MIVIFIVCSGIMVQNCLVKTRRKDVAESVVLNQNLFPQRGSHLMNELDFASAKGQN